MAVIYKDRVAQYSTTKGTGTFTLGTTLPEGQSFSAIGDGNECTYLARDAQSNDWEIGLGTYTAAGTTLSRDTVLASSIGGAKVNFVNNPEIHHVLTAERVVTNDRNAEFRAGTQFQVKAIRDGSTGYRAESYLSSAGVHCVWESRSARGTESAPEDIVSGDQVAAFRAAPRVSGAFNSGLVGGSLWGVYNGSGVWWTISGATAPGSPVSGGFNAVEIYDNGTAICYPIEAAVTGTIDLEKWDRLVPDTEDGQTRGKHEMAARFKSRQEMMLDPHQYSDFWMQHMHLPNLPSYDDWLNNGKLSVGEVMRRLWETVECQAVHIKKLLDRIDDLEKKMPGG